MYASARLCYNYSKASMQLLLVNNWLVYCGMQAKSVCILCTYDGIKVGLLYNNAGYVM